MSYISELRKYVGHKALMSNAASCILFDKEKGILLERRTDNGQWCIPGGATEIGEEPEEGLLREVKEETGLDISDPELLMVKANIHVVYPNKDEVYYTDFVYVVTKYRGELSHDSESSELKWFEADKLPGNIMANHIDYLKEFRLKILKME